jgi:hypothetical protein
MSKAVKITIYKMVEIPAAVFGSETRAVTEMGMKNRAHGRGRY